MNDNEILSNDNQILSNDNEILSIDTGELAKVKPTATKVEVPTFKLVPENDPILFETIEDFNFEDAPVNPNAFASSLFGSRVCVLIICQPREAKFARYSVVPLSTDALSTTIFWILPS